MQENLDLWEMTSGIFRVLVCFVRQWLHDHASFPEAEDFTRSQREGPLVSDSHLYVSWCRLMSTGAGFYGRCLPECSRFPYFPGSTVDTCSRQSGMLWLGRLRCTSRCAFRQRQVQGWFCISCVPGGPTGAVLGQVWRARCVLRQVRSVLSVQVERGYPTGAVLGYVIDMPVVVHVKVVDITVVAQRPFPLVPCCSRLIRWSISWLGRSWGAGREESVEIPQLLLIVA